LFTSKLWKFLNMGNYAATTVRISNITKHPNADRLQLTNLFGNTVIVGLDIKVGDLGVFFPVESQLSEEFSKANDLIRRRDAEGKPAGGMLEENRRIRAIKLRGTPSMGLWLPISCLDYLPGGPMLNTTEEGLEFEDLRCNDGKDHHICQKYIPKRNQPQGTGGKKEARKPRESKIIDGQFRFHFDTAQLGKNIHKLTPTDIISVTWKLHGTSAIVGNVLVKKQTKWYDKLASKIGVDVRKEGYEYIYASRRVVKNEFMEAKQHFYTEDLWSRVGKDNFEGKLHQGEQVYYEILGYTKDGAFIQKGYDYKCAPGTNKIYIYRITQTSPDGSVIELQWNQVKERCLELGVSSVPEIFYGNAEALFCTLDQDNHWHENYLENLKRIYVHDQDSQFCDNKVPEEGICVRKEGLNIEVFKLKSFKFLEHETKALDAGQVDVETEQTITE
jgi:hypothetical protein